MKNYIYFGGRFKIRYVYFDTPDYLADSIFCKYEIPVYYGNEWTKPGEPYKLIECKVKKKYKEKFEKALDEIPTKMNLLGHTDYEEYCQKMITMFQEGDEDE